jgi:hypothetical protein
MRPRVKHHAGAKSLRARNDGKTALDRVDPAEQVPATAPRSDIGREVQRWLQREAASRRCDLEERILAFRVPTGAMDTNMTFQHRAYDLLCRAKAVDGGKLAPALVTCQQAWPIRPRAIAVRRGDYATEGAVEIAEHKQGVEWTLNCG